MTNEGRTRPYNIWVTMRSRCFTVTDDAYPRYGGRGITICPEWDSFEAFEAWAMANGYQDDLTIDRIDNDGPYAPQNCRWATRTEQARNRCNNKRITFNGETKPAVEFAEQMGIRPHTLYRRLSLGWSVEDALTTPVKGGGHRVRMH